MSLQPPYARPPGFLATTASVSLVGHGGRPDVLLRSHQPTEAPEPAKRSKIWELADTLHCSIIGTCLSTAELRHVLVRVGAAGAETADEHELHVLGVMLASRREAGAKLLQRALDRRHGMAIKQYAKAKDEDSLSRLWDESAQSGDIPGGYWALLSHPAATEAVVKKAFRAVHMLSHLVGAANRADIRRLRDMEKEIGALREKLDRQQQQLRDGFTARDERIRHLNDMLIRSVDQPSGGPGANQNAEGEVATLRNVTAELNRKLAQENTRRERLEQRLAATSAALKKTEAAWRRAESERDAFAHDLALIEAHLLGPLPSASHDGAGMPDLSGRTILYVGGRANQIPQLKALVERTGARFLHHDGGIEHSATLLPGLISKADDLFFPVDCISHDAVVTIKRVCRQVNKPYHALRTASLAALMASLAMVDRKHAGVAAE